ncbi:MAG TPA: BrnT family toxin [Chloroflexota bacterium]|jgi:uncharacterized DUF497 family protein
MPSTPLTFKWDEAKSRSNVAKHRVAFEEAAAVVSDPLSLTIADPDHSSAGDERYITLGFSQDARLLMVVHSDDSDIIRIISARLANRRERLAYEEGNS